MVDCYPLWMVLGGVAGLGGFTGHAILSVFRGDPMAAALRSERDRAKVEVLALAILADGEISNEERAAIDAFIAKESAERKAEVAKLLDSAVDLRSPAVLRERIEKAALILEPNERVEVFAVVKNLAHRGSRAWGEDETYRSAGPSPDALVAIFRDALGITTAS